MTRIIDLPNPFESAPEAGRAEKTCNRTRVKFPGSAPIPMSSTSRRSCNAIPTTRFVFHQPESKGAKSCCFYLPLALGGQREHSQFPWEVLEMASPVVYFVAAGE